MAKVAETIVDDWLNRKGYFTIRGLKKRGRNEIDLLAFRPSDRDALHIEVTSNDKPTGWLGGNLKASASKKEKEENIERFVTRKYRGANEQLRNRVPQSLNWRCMLAFNVLDDQEEEQTRVLKDQFRVESVSLSEILSDLASEQALTFYTDSDAAHFAEITDVHRNGG